MAFTPLGDALHQRMTKNQPLKKQVETSLVIEIAEKVIAKILGVENSRMAKPLFLKNRTLTITCSGSVAAQEIRLHQQEIVEKINQELGKSEVDRIRYLA